jgi:hypothetical protein
MATFTPTARPPTVDQANTELVRRGLRMSTVFGARRHEQFPDGLPWTCTLRYKRRRMTIVYYTHPGFQEEPTVAEVLTSLFEDAWRFQHVRDFVEFCAAFGYDRDGRRSEWAYTACGDAAARLRHLMHDDYPGSAVALSGIRPIVQRPNGEQPAVPLIASPSEAKISTLPLGQVRM